MRHYVKEFFGREMVRFAMVGLVSTSVDILVLKLLSNRIALTTDIAMAFLSGLTVGYFLNSKYVFAKDKSASRYTRYLLVSLGGLCITEGIIHFLLQVGATSSEVTAKLFAVAVVFFWNYGWSKVWAFK